MTVSLYNIKGKLLSVVTSFYRWIESLYEYTTVCLPISLLIDLWVVFHLGPVMNKTAMNIFVPFLCVCVYKHCGITGS